MLVHQTVGALRPTYVRYCGKALARDSPLLGMSIVYGGHLWLYMRAVGAEDELNPFID